MGRPARPPRQRARPGAGGLTEDLRPLLTDAYAAVAKDATRTEATLRYQPSVPLAAEPAEPDGSGETSGDDEPVGVPDQETVEAAFRAELVRRQREEVQRGLTLVGPHRDELALGVGTLPVKGYASHGESWSFALALRLASYDLLRQDGDDPILILDDVFAELDADRRERLAEMVADAEQVLVTAAVAADVPAVLAGARVDVRRDAEA